MAQLRAKKADLDSRIFLDGAIYLYRRKCSRRGLWEIRLKVHGHKGYILRSSGTANEHAAYKLAYQLYMDCLARQQVGRQVDSKRIISGLDDFLNAHEAIARPADFRSVLAVARMLKSFVGSDRLDAIDRAYVAKMLDYVAANGRKGTASPNTYRRNLTRLKAILKWWVANDYLPMMPSLPTYPQVRNRRPHFSNTDWAKVEHVLPEFLRADGVATRRDRLLLVNWMMVMVHTGLRMGEARALCWEHIRPITDPFSGTIVSVALNVQGKTGKRTVVASSPDVRRYLAALLDLRRSDLQNPAADIFLQNDVPPSSLVFCHPNGKPIGSFKKSFLALLKLAGVTHSPEGVLRTPYSLRHTYATERLNAGVQEYHLAKNMGTSVAMLEQHYGHTSNVANVFELIKKPAANRSGKEGQAGGLDWLTAARICS